MIKVLSRRYKNERRLSNYVYRVPSISFVSGRMRKWQNTWRCSSLISSNSFLPLTSLAFACLFTAIVFSWRTWYTAFANIIALFVISIKTLSTAWKTISTILAIERHAINALQHARYLINGCYRRVFGSDYRSGFDKICIVARHAPRLGRNKPNVITSVRFDISNPSRNTLTLTSSTRLSRFGHQLKISFIFLFFISFSFSSYFLLPPSRFPLPASRFPPFRSSVQHHAFTARLIILFEIGGDALISAI